MRKFIVILLIALMATLGLWYVFNDVPEEPVVITEEEKPVDEDKQFVISAVTTDVYGVKDDSSFKVEGNVSAEELEKNLIIEPAVAFDVEKVTDTEYIIKPTQSLKKNKVYTFTMTDFDYGKAFQVVDDLKVYNHYPGNGVYDVPNRSYIELFFNSNKVTDLEPYFSISPEVQGEFKYEGEKVMFVPVSFDSGLEYTVTIKSGVTDGERTLMEDKTFSFTTGYSDDFQSWINYSVVNANPLEESIINIKDYSQASSYHTEIYQIVDFDAYVAYYDEFLENRKALTFEENPVYEEDLAPISYHYNDYLTMPKLEKGHYIVKTDSTTNMQYTFLQVDPHQVYYTKAVNGHLFWVMDHVNKTPAADMNILADQAILATTDETGVAIIDTESTSFVIDTGDNQLLVKVENDQQYYDSYYMGYSSYDHWSFLYTDRRAYLPTDEIKVFGFVRSFTDEPIGSLSLVITKWWDDENEVVKETKLGSYNTLTDSINLIDYEPGYYQLQLKMGDVVLESSEIIVTSYEKPEVYMTATADKTAVYSGDTVKVNIEAKYFNDLPYEDLHVIFYSDGTSIGIENTDSFGMIEKDIIIRREQDEWYPSFYHISAESRDVQDTYVNAHVGIDVFSRDTMILTSVDKTDTIATVSLETSLIDISNYEGTYGDNYSNIKGESVDLDYEVTIEDRYSEKIFKGTKVHPIHKVTYDEYEYRSRTELLNPISGATVNGQDAFSFEYDKDHSYTIKITSKDSMGRTVVAREWLSGNYYWLDNEDVYSIPRTNEKYDIGESVSYSVLKSGEEITTSPDDYMLNLKLRHGILSYEVSEDAQYSFDFLKSDRPNVLFKAIYYDGNTMTILPKWSSGFIPYDFETLEVDLSYSSDKSLYEPSEQAGIEVYITKEGKPFNGMLNISIVDEAYLSLYPDYFELGNNLHSFVYDDGILVETVTNEAADELSGAEGGEGGDGDYIRDDFKDTAYFETIEIIDGIGKVSVDLPDNLTSWRLTMQAVNTELEYGSLKGSVKVVLPFFVRSLNNKEYITGDELYLTVNADGEELNDETIQYRARLLDGETVLEESSQSMDGKGYVQLPLGHLEEGEYDTIVEGFMKDFADGIKESIVVKDTYLETTHFESNMLTENFEPTYNRKTTLSIYNQAAEDYIHMIYKTRKYSVHRLEEIIGGFEADKLLSSYFDLDSTVYDVSKYQSYEGGIQQLVTSNPTVYTTAMLLGTHMSDTYFDVSKMKMYLRDNLESEENSDLVKTIALWGLASQKEPVLLGIDAFIDVNDSIDQKQKLYLGLAMTELGDTTRAKEYINAVLDEKLTGLAANEKLLLGSAVIKLKIESSVFTDDYTDLVVSSDSLVLEKLNYIKLLPVTFDEASFAYVLNNEETTVTLPDLNSHQIKLSKGDKITFKNISDGLKINEWMTVIGTDYENYKTGIFKIEQEMPDTVAFGERVKVVMTFEKPGGNNEYSFAVVKTKIPAGFEFVGSSGSVRVYSDNQDITAYLYKEDTDKIEYYISAVQAGVYHTEPVIIQNAYEGILYMSDPDVIEVRHD